MLYPQYDINAADINGDGVINNGDIDPFVGVLTGLGKLSRKSRTLLHGA